MFDYAKQVREFERLLMIHPARLSWPAQVLWYRLNSLVDRQGGKVEVVASSGELEELLGATRRTLAKLRDELIDEKLISMEWAGVRGRPSVYRVEVLGGWKDEC